MGSTITFIGTVHSTLKKREDCPLQEHEGAPEATIEVLPEFVEGIKDIGEGAEVLVFTWLHEADRSIIKCRQRKDTTGPMKGVFSTRSPDRPNPIGLHSVKVLSVSRNGLIKVSGLEVLDKTPVVDIKPVI
jgi:tRNA-Thr(GGU) m(6)t(6)A37 methyltransferase TsaA